MGRTGLRSAIAVITRSSRVWEGDSLRSVSLVVSAIAMSLLALPGSAHADVMEIRNGQASWIAGGSQAAPAADLELTLGSDAASAGVLHPSSVTDVGSAAGPERWQAKVAELAAKYDISPALLEAVVWQESRWNASAVSPAGARGLAQLMPGTARAMGVDPNDPYANLEGGARYLRMQLDAFDGDLEKALAAYNAGPNRVVSAGGVPAIRETQNYVASIMARLAEPVRR